MLIYWLFY